MSRSSYTSSERRGILVIALIALLIIGSGVVLALCGRPREKTEEIPVVIEQAQLIDSTGIEAKKLKGKQNARQNKGTKSNKKKGQKPFDNSLKEKRKRSPLDETV